MAAKFGKLLLTFICFPSPFFVCFPQPDTGPITPCYTFECLTIVLKYISDRGEVPVGVVSSDFQSDNYMALYLGGVIENFSKSPYPMHFLLFSPPERDILQASIMLLSLLPKRSVFFVYEHGKSAFGIRNMAVARLDLNIGPAVILHLNHEQPWVFDRSLQDLEEMKFDYVFPDIQSLIIACAIHPLVLRNYYYKPLNIASAYFPVGAPLHRYMVSNTTSAFTLASLKTSSERSVYCAFSGRHLYDVPPLHEQANERSELLEMYERRELGPCQISVGNEKKKDYHNHEYEEYMMLLTDTVFVLCPAGNNPETFRHYEALEAGAIPLFVAPSNKDRNYLTYGLWSEYPGPIFTSWKAIGPFFRHMTKEKMNQLQSQISSWFALFKEGIKEHIGNELKRAFDFVDSHPEIPENIEFWNGSVPDWMTIKDVARPKGTKDTQLPAVLHLRYDKKDPEGMEEAQRLWGLMGGGGGGGGSGPPPGVVVPAVAVVAGGSGDDTGMGMGADDGNGVAAVDPRDHSLWGSMKGVSTHPHVMHTHVPQKDQPQQQQQQFSHGAAKNIQPTIPICDCSALQNDDNLQLQEDLVLLQTGLDHYKTHEQQLEQQLADAHRNIEKLKSMLMELGVSEETILLQVKHNT